MSKIHHRDPFTPPPKKVSQNVQSSRFLSKSVNSGAARLLNIGGSCTHGSGQTPNQANRNSDRSVGISPQNQAKMGRWEGARGRYSTPPTDGCAHGSPVPGQPSQAATRVCTATRLLVTTEVRAYGHFEHAQGKARGVKYRGITGIMPISPKEPGSTRQNHAQARNSARYSLIYPMF